VGPGGTLGGLEWGSAVDGNQIYTAIANNNYVPQQMIKGPIAGQTIAGGFWAALDAATGTVNWQNAGSNPPVTIPGFPSPPPGAVVINLGMVTVANGVMFAGATDAVGTMYALNAATGDKLWSFEAGGSVNAGPAVVNGIVYWGSGYSNFGLGTPNHKLYAFQVKDVNAALTSINPRSGVSAPTEKTSASISVYPSPAWDVIRIKTNDRSNINTVRLFDLSGRLLKEVKVAGSPVYNFDVSSVQKGDYMINVISSTLDKSVKVVVVH